MRRAVQEVLPRYLSVVSSKEGGSSSRSNFELTSSLLLVLNEVERELGFLRAQGRLNGSLPGNSYLIELLSQAAQRIGLDLTSAERDLIISRLECSELPFGILQPLVDDPEVSDIVVSSFSRVTIQIGRRSANTDLSFGSQEAYEAFVEKLLQRAGATYSTKKPVADGMIDAYARIHAVHSSISDGGPYLTIRINRFSAVQSDDLVAFGMGPQAVLDYLKGLVACGRTLLIAGEVGTGKTTLVRALASGVPLDESILVIEDTPEIRLEHPHVRYVATREANTDGAGRVSPAELIRAGMRMAMNRIVFGEIRDSEAAESFIDVCASGHPGLSTIHARSAADALVRLELFLGRAQRGAGRNILREQITTAVQVVVFVSFCRATARRRIVDVRELDCVADEVIRQRQIFAYELRAGLPTWKVVNRVSLFRTDLEALTAPLDLGSLSQHIEPEPSDLFREAVSRRRAGIKL
ncbi:MAG: Flp pilus assembly complex ATPase component TadA [Oligoflexia bacterium]|nr:Flp pilus assembly complex ATPase component TadA [Oligoflexia bacterium]